MNRQEFEKVVNTRIRSLAGNLRQEGFPALYPNKIHKIIVRSFSYGFINLNLVENELRDDSMYGLDCFLGDEMPFSADLHDYSKDKLIKYLTTVFEEVTPKDWRIRYIFSNGALHISLDTSPEGYTLNAFPHNEVQCEMEEYLRQTGKEKIGVFVEWEYPLWTASLIVNKNTGQCWCFDTEEKLNYFFNANVLPLLLEKIKQMFPEFVANQQMMTLPNW